MSKVANTIPLILVLILTASSLIIIESASAQSIPKPSVAQFTLQIVDYGVQMTIQNQQIIANGHDTANIFYNIRLKSHDSQNWVSTTVPDSSQGIRGYIGEIGTSGSTILLKDFNSIDVLLGLSYDSHQIDYQVEAINGYLNATPAFFPQFGFDPNSTPVVIVNTSGWSNTQTITIPEVSANTSPNPTSSSNPTIIQNPTPTPTVPEFSWLATLPLFISALFIPVIFRQRKTHQIKKLN
jgi:hypothetical protein